MPEQGLVPTRFRINLNPQLPAGLANPAPVQPQPAAPEPPKTPGFLREVWNQWAGPADIAKGIGEMAMHPWDTSVAIGNQWADMGKGAVNEFSRGNLLGGLRRTINTGIDVVAPGLGKQSEEAGQAFERGNYREGLVKTAGAGANAATMAVLPRVVKPLAYGTAETITPGLTGPLGRFMEAHPALAEERGSLPLSVFRSNAMEFARRGGSEPGFLVRPSGELVDLSENARHWNMVSDLNGEMQRGAIRGRGNGIEYRTEDVDPAALRLALQRAAARGNEVYVDGPFGSRVYNSSDLVANNYSLLRTKPARPVSWFGDERGSFSNKPVEPAIRTLRGLERDKGFPFGFISPKGKVNWTSSAAPTHEDLASALGFADKYAARDAGYVRFTYRYGNNSEHALELLDTPRTRELAAQYITQMEPRRVAIDLVDPVTKQYRGKWYSDPAAAVMDLLGGGASPDAGVPGPKLKRTPPPHSSPMR